MNEKRYEVFMFSASTTPLGAYSNGGEIMHQGFDTKEEAVNYAKSQKDNYSVVRVKKTGTSEVILAFEGGNLIDDV